MGEIINNTTESGVVIPFKRPEKINKVVFNILNQSSGYIWDKNDIIGALLSNGSLDIEGDPINYLLYEKYNFLYEKVIDFICSIGELYYYESGYTFEYNKEEKYIYIIDNATISLNDSYKLDISLITNDDYSNTIIEIKYKDNVMLILSDEYSAMTGYIPFEDYNL